MSYILDALRKSEQQRTRGAAPSLLVVPVTDAPQRRTFSLWYGVLAAILVIAGIGIGMMRPWQTDVPPQSVIAAKPQAAPARNGTAASPGPATETSGKDAPQAAVVPATSAASVAAPAGTTWVGDTGKTVLPAQAEGTPKTTPAASGIDAAKGPPTPPSEPAKLQGLPSRGETASATQIAGAKAAPATKEAEPAAGAGGKAVAGSVEKSAPAKPIDAAQERAPVTFAELPLAVQQEMPKVTVQFHLYSGNPKDRLAGINDRMLREGDTIAPGLVLEQITSDGMVLTFKGHRFLRGAR